MSDDSDDGFAALPDCPDVEPDDSDDDEFPELEIADAAPADTNHGDAASSKETDDSQLSGSFFSYGADGTRTAAQHEHLSERMHAAKARKKQRRQEDGFINAGELMLACASGGLESKVAASTNFSKRCANMLNGFRKAGVQ